MGEIDWTSDVFAKVPTQNPAAIMKAIDKMIVMGAAMDSSALKAGGDAHHKAIGSMDVYNAIASFNLGTDIGPYMMSKVNAADAKAAYSAFLEFKDVVKAS